MRKRFYITTAIDYLNGLPHLGHATFTKSARLASGLPVPSGTQSSGSTTGRSFSGTGTAPQPSQWMIGIGVP